MRPPREQPFRRLEGCSSNGAALRLEDILGLSRAACSGRSARIVRGKQSYNPRPLNFLQVRAGRAPAEHSRRIEPLAIAHERIDQADKRVVAMLPANCLVKASPMLLEAPVTTGKGLPDWFISDSICCSLGAIGLPGPTLRHYRQQVYVLTWSFALSLPEFERQSNISRGVTVYTVG